MDELRIEFKKRLLESKFLGISGYSEQLKTNALVNNHVKTTFPQQIPSSKQEKLISFDYVYCDLIVHDISKSNFPDISSILKNFDVCRYFIGEYRKFRFSK